MATASRTRVTTFVAVGVHIALFLAAASRSRAPRASEVFQGGDEKVDSIEISLSAETPAEGTATAHEDPSGPSAAARRSLAEPAPTSPPAPREQRVAGATPESSASPVMLFVPSPSMIGLSSGGTINPFFSPGALPEQPAASPGPSAPARPVEARAIAESQRAVDRALKEPMQARIDKSIGPEGPVLHALQDATYGGFAPLVGSATFVALVDANGLVIDLRLLHAHPRGKDAESGWDDARKHAAEALAGKKLALRGARGAELRIEVESDLRLPSGRRATDFPVKPAFSASSIELPPNVSGAGLPGDSVKAYTVGTFDLADIGAKPRSVVHTRLVEAREM